MVMYDWAIIAIAVAFIVRGWMRGAIREGLEVGLLLVGTVIAFRLAPGVGAVLSGMANIPYEVARVIAGVLVFGVLVAASILLGQMLSRTLRIVPVAGAIDRLGGSAIGIVYAAIVAVLATTLLSAMPLPAAARDAIDEQIAESSVGRSVVDPTGLVQPVVTVASGERVMGAIVAVRHAVGERLVDGSIPLPLPSVERSDLAPSQTLAQIVFDDLNRERIRSGLDPLAWNSDLAIVAVARATDVYSSGWLRLNDDLTDALAVAGVPGTVHDDQVVMAASSSGVVEALSRSGDNASSVGSSYRKGGIGVVEGPYGLVAVQVLAG